ncbi:hypothetical protein GCM10010389_24620 [Streptomyces echinoruber]|uniref:Uncharacterized protein n=1 Tax=Streptomyces echinoruber TaxID=68898 RepID=A0A918R3K5_9ACTN|nr:hypothetical protein GCM10010389_24620 [Streptomyces echinoruber]
MLGGLNAEPSGSAADGCGTFRPSGTANSEVTSDSGTARGTASPSGIANSQVVDASPSPSTVPTGGRNALLASSDCGVRSSASVTGQRSLNDTFRKPQYVHR